MAGTKRSLDHPKAIDVSMSATLDQSVEVARLWVENGGQATCFVHAESLAEPEMLGFLVVDAIHAGARAFAQCDGMAEDVALRRIWRGVETRGQLAGLDNIEEDPKS